MKKLIAANDNNLLFYVYLWRDANGQPFYVGKGRDRRAYDLYDRSKEFMAVHSRGGCSVEIVDWFVHESQALAFEVELIAQYGRRDMGGVLVNKTDGGDGCVGHVKSPETIEKWRAKNVGQKRSPEVCAKISAAKMGHDVSKETRQRLSAAVTKRFEDPAERERMRQRALNISDETRAKMSSSHKRRLSDPAERQKLSALMQGKTHTKETKAKISAARTGVPKSEETLAAMRVAQRMKPPRGKFKGVSGDRVKWRAIIYVGGRNQSLGFFDTPEDAARAYDAAAYAAHGADCYLNFPLPANDNHSQTHGQAIVA